MSAVRYPLLRAWILPVLLIIFWIPAQAAPRVALVIGNASYAHAPELENPLNDAADVAAALRRLGFSVTKLENANFAELRKGLLEFTLAASASEVAVVFYAGLGIEVDQRNFLVPVDARLASDQSVEFEAVPLDLVQQAVSRASVLRLVVLDACRENPFSASMQRAGATRSIGRGLARVEPAGDTLVAYAAKEGTLAADGQGRNSPYSKALLAHLEEPGLEVGLMFRRVRDAVLTSTGGRQEPFVYGSLSSRGVYLAEAPAIGAAPVEDTAIASARLEAERLAVEREFWSSVKNSNDPEEFRAYLERYPAGTYESLARTRLARLERASGSPDPLETTTTAAATSAERAPEAISATPEVEEEALGLTRAQRSVVQQGLTALGFDAGTSDGRFGSRTRMAIREWQSSQGKSATGFLDEEGVGVLLEAGRKAVTQTVVGDLAGVIRGFEEIRSVLPKALQAARGIKDSMDRAGAYAGIARVQAETGDIGGALETAQRVKREFHRSRVFADIARVQAETGDIGGALETAQRVKREFHRSRVFADIARVQAETGDIRGALETVQTIQAGSYRAVALASIAGAQGETGDIRSAMQSVADAQLDVRGEEADAHRAKAFASIAVAQAKIGDIGSAMQSIANARAAAEGETAEALRAGAFASIAEAQAKAGDIRGALETTQKIELDSHHAEALANIARVQAESGDIRSAIQFITDAQAVAGRVEDQPSRVWVFAKIATAQIESGDAQGVLLSMSNAQTAAEKVGDRFVFFGAFAEFLGVLARMAEEAREAG